MNLFLFILGCVALYIIYKIVSSTRKRNAENKKQRWLLELQHAHDKGNHKEILRLMNGKEPDNTALCHVLGNALISTGELEKGKSMFKKAFSYGDKNLTRKNFGYSLLNNGQYKEAIPLLQEIEKDYLANEFKYDSGYDIIENLALCFTKIGKYDLAIETLKSAPLGKRNIVDGLNKLFILLADCYAHQGDEKNAVKYLTKSIAYKYDEELQMKLEKIQNSVKK